jgi:hypothetical protein
LALVILTVFAFAKVCAGYLSNKAFAIFFSAIGLLAIAASDMQFLIISFVQSCTFVFTTECIRILLFGFLND